MLAIASELTLIAVIIHIVVVGLLGWQVYRHSTGIMRYGGFVLLYSWLGAVIIITQSGMVEDTTSVLSPLGFVMTTTIFIGLWMIFYWQPLKKVIAQIPLSWLMGIQIYRVLGIVFLIGWLNGEIPTALGPITAFYDVFIGVTALIVVYLLVNRPSNNTIRLAKIWNILGILDFVYAITVGVLGAPHALRLLQLTPDTSALGLLPLSFIVLWAVPLSILLHTMSLIKLNQLSPK
ncbi:MAG: hypothetical protein MUE54_05365 [Anaerolineae bacterium]|jgi:hypothetical protein|nr:hypothetical protein [Anaerolineae bacterium]